MKNKTLILFIAAMIVLTGTTFGAGYLSKHMKQGLRTPEKNLFRGQMLLRMKSEIGLTTEQVGRIEQMNLSFQEAMIKRTADVKVMELKLAAYLQGDKVNRKTAEKMIREIAGLKTGLQIDRINYFLDLKELLTPEQLEKIEKIKKTARRRTFSRDRGRDGRAGGDRNRPMRRPGIR